MKLEDIRFPLYVVHSEDVITRDGLLWCEGAIIDDRNIKGNSLGERRLLTPQKNLYDLKYQLSIEEDSMLIQMESFLFMKRVRKQH